MAALRAGIGDGFYMVYFQQPGVADAELDADRPATFRRILSSASGDGTDGPGPAGLPVVPPGGGFLDICPEPRALPAWLTGPDIDSYAAQYATAGFTGPLNWYRNLDRNWELTAPWHHAPAACPGPVRRRRPGPGHPVPRHPGEPGPAGPGRPAAARAGAAARLRALDPAGAARRGERGDDQLPAGPGLTVPAGAAPPSAAASPPDAAAGRGGFSPARSRASCHSSS